MKKRQIITLISLLLVTIMGFGAYSFMHRDKGLSDEEIKDMFACSRVTADYRETDVYCDNPDLYREHLSQNQVLEP